MAPSLPSTPAPCSPWLLERRCLLEVGGVERDPGTGVTWSPEEDGGVHGEHNLPKIWGHAPSSFAIGSGNHR